MAACTTALEGNNGYLVSIGSLDGTFTLEKEYKVIGDPLEKKTVHAVVGSLAELEYCVHML